MRFVFEAYLGNKPYIGIGLNDTREVLDLLSRPFIERRTIGRWRPVLSLFAEAAQVTPGSGHHSVKQAGLLQPA